MAARAKLAKIIIRRLRKYREDRNFFRISPAMLNVMRTIELKLDEGMRERDLETLKKIQPA